LLLLPLCGFSQNLAPNPSFESGTSTPTSWSYVGTGVWETNGLSGARSVSVAGAAVSTRYWYTYGSPVAQGQAYVVSFKSFTTNMTKGYCIGGFNTVSRDFARPGTRWADFSYVAWIPSNGVPFLRLQVWDADGAIYFDDVEVLPLNPVHARVGAYDLGVGESLNAGRYVFKTRYDGYSANYSRCLLQANVTFNSVKWYLGADFGAGKAVIYQHTLGGQTFSNAQVSCAIQNYQNLTNSTVAVEASTNGTAWQSCGTLLGTNASTFNVPASLLPAAQVFIRLAGPYSGQFALTNYSFAADVPDTTTSGPGDTWCFGQWIASSPVKIAAVSNTPAGRVVTLAIPNSTPTNQTFSVSAQAEFVGNLRERTLSTTVAPGATNLVSIRLPTAGFGDNTATLTVKDGNATPIFQNNLRYNVSILADDSYGELLPSPTNCPVWWCDGAYKVGLTRREPIATNTAARVFAARNDYEPFQIVLRPETTLSNITVSISDFVSATNPAVRIASTNVSTCRVEYVPVTILDHEPYSTLGDHPDPLVPLTAPFDAPAQTNSPLWFTVHVPKDAAAGDYDADVTLNTSAGSFTVPVRLRIYNFTLTDVTHSRTAYGLSPQEPWTWHGLGYIPTAQHVEVWEYYLQNMARHRISPFYPQYFAEIGWTYNATDQSFAFNFSQFDAVMPQFIEEYHFNTFKDIYRYHALPPIAGVPTYNSNTSAINPAYRALYTKLMQPVVQHFREKGWADKAYSYWFDEPQPYHTSLVRDGNQMIEETAPDLARLQTEFGGPNGILNASLWVPHLGGLNTNLVQERQAAGEKVLYYVATGPKAPWPNNFIDHPAINPRIRSWYAEKFNLDGELYYGINYYLGNPNPWLDAMELSVSVAGVTNYWGNGDGSLLYPPVKTPPASPLIAAPFDSIRWEMLREGVEDREFFWLLERALPPAESRLGTNHPAVLEARAAKDAAMGMLALPFLYPYETDKLYASRRRIAEAIEGIEDGAPFIAENPLSKVVTVGAAETLRVEASGWPAPVIQWQHAGTNLPGATGAKLSLTSITLDMAGSYTAVASNSIGVITSAAGTLTVLTSNQPPQIIAHPADLTRTNGGRAVFGVGASSLTPVSYQWLHDGALLAGATNVTLLRTNLTTLHAGLYSVLASNSSGTTMSSPATLYIQGPGGTIAPVITSQPTNQTVLAGLAAQFEVTAGGTQPLVYQWQFNGTNLPADGNASVLTLTNVQLPQAGPYRVIVSNVAGVVTSAVATLTVQTVAPFITGHPTNLTVIEGQNAQFAVAAGGTDPLAYQWFFNQTNALAGANGSTLTLTNVQPSHAGSYSVLVTNAVGAVTSAPALLQLQGMPNYTNEPPSLGIELLGSDLVLVLAPDNRPRTVLASTNLVDWTDFYSATPSAAQVLVPVPTTNSPRCFFRLLLVILDFTNEPPGLGIERQDSDLMLLLAPDNRSRTVLVSTNLIDWSEFHSASPSSSQLSVPVATTNSPGRFFRLLVVP
jgi:hypothetical protein